MRGSVMKRGKTWSYVLYLGRDRDGKKRQQWVGGFPTRRLADAALIDALDRRSKGTWADAGRMTVGEYLAEWLAGIRPTVRDKTAASYEATLPPLGPNHANRIPTARRAHRHPPPARSPRRAPQSRGDAMAKAGSRPARCSTHIASCFMRSRKPLKRACSRAIRHRSSTRPESRSER